jgi:lipopolysaccharide transport system ATP-binding protein
MNSSIAIEATNLSKKYRLGTIGMTSLREDLGRWWKRKDNNVLGVKQETITSINQSRMIKDHEFWALHDLNFQIPKGEVVGLIGANGSGKSTLLKILSRITEPTEGEVRIRGKVASLLEVGTGFHPELTGRENVYVNGAILGMTRREVDKKFDEIVDFAGVPDFIDTPIKRYSSGMTVRLGFAVAAHLDPDILIVDEVLAVGDAAFQEKCIGKMKSISNSGRTIIFVSHNMASVEALCTQSIFLDHGKIISIGSPKTIIEEYIDKETPDQENQLKNRNDRQGNGLIRLTEVKIVDDELQKINFAKTGGTLSLLITFSHTEKSYTSTRFCLSLTNGKGERISTVCSNLVNYYHDFSKNNAILIKLDNLN